MSGERAPAKDDVARIERVIGRRALELTRVGRGYTPAERWRVRTAGGETVFAKIGVDSKTSLWLRHERQVYAEVEGPFLPRCLGWDDPGSRPVLVLEDLSDAHWPPPWSAGDIDAARSALAELHAAHPSVPSFRERHGARGFEGWTVVARDPEPFLGVGVATPRWLERCLPALLEAESRVTRDGTALTHFDVRSDNLCVRGARALLVDWSAGCLGNPVLDLAFWLPSLRSEGGPEPEALLDAPAEAALVAGFFAGRAGLPHLPEAPRVRSVQRAQLVTALPWACRSLGLPAPDGAG